MQPRRSAPTEGDNLMVGHDWARIMAILDSPLTMSLRSLAIFLPIHLHLLSLASTFATISYDYHTYEYEAQRWHICPHRSIRCTASHDYGNGYGNDTNVDVHNADNDDDDNEEHESGYRHDAMESCQDFKMNDNWGRRLVKNETDCQDGTQSESPDTIGRQSCNIATRMFSDRTLTTFCVTTIPRVLACGW